MATGVSELSSDEFSDSQCFTCENNLAVKFCVECQGYLCKTCAHIHSRIPVSKGHTLLDKNTDTSSRGQVLELPMIPTERCNIHVTKLVDMYCKDHDEVGCTTCMALNHRSCSDVHSIPDDIDELYKATDIEDTNRSLQRNEERIRMIEIQREEDLTILNLSREKADMTIENAKQELISHVENLTREAKEKVEKEFQIVKAQCEKEKEEAHIKLDDIKRKSAELKISEGNKPQQFVCMKIANQKVKETEEMEKKSLYNKKVAISFEVDSSIHMLSRDIKTFGRVSCTMGTKGYSIDRIKDVNVKVKDDKSTCYINDSCLTEDGRLILVDNNNKNLKRVNIETMHVNSVCSFDNNPFCVCCTDKDEAVVTFYTYAKFIQFVSIGTQLTPSRKVNINHDCCGITYKDDKLYITDNDKTLYIHDMTGNELQKISTDISGNGLFSYVREICFSEYITGSIVADRDKGLIILNDQYQRIAGYSDAGLHHAISVCTDGRGSIFVCGYSSHNVLQIGYDGEKIGDIIGKSNRIGTPRSLCFDSSRCTLILTLFERDVIKLIRLK